MKALNHFIVLCCVLYNFVVLFESIYSVSGESLYSVRLNNNWTLTNRNMSIVKRGVRIPSGVYSDLYGEEVIESYNDVNMRWIGYDNWTYTKKFSLKSQEYSTLHSINITFHGIDTFSIIRLNDVTLGYTNNMFTRYTFDVKFIISDENKLEVEILSPVFAGRSIVRYNNRTLPPECPDERIRGECHINRMRKMQISFGWDWAPAVPSMGIWKQVELEYFAIALLRDIDVGISKNGTHWIMNICAYIESKMDKPFVAELKFHAPEFVTKPMVYGDYDVSEPKTNISFVHTVPLENVVAWWPHGYGEQRLYTLTFTLNVWETPNNVNLRQESLSHKIIRIGFRTVELVQTPIFNGKTFSFKINGKDIFIKGSNYVPMHILPEKGNNPLRYKEIFVAAKEAHMNMLRVWGGGIYESDLFYDFADTYGILIWQDMMFSRAVYPVHSGFIPSVRTEIIQNIRRIAYHPSIAIFVGNNECELILTENRYDTIYDKPYFEKIYNELFVDGVLKELEKMSSGGRAQPLVSTPSDGDNYNNYTYYTSSNDDIFGERHYYPTMSDSWNPNIYPKPRFISEYGVMSLPNMQAWNRTLGGNDTLIDLIQHRQHSPRAMAPILELVRRHLPLPPHRKKNYVQSMVYLSQVAQAMGVKTATEHFRSMRESIYKTSGALYFQLNDIWVAPSYSSIDFYGNYKILHHWAKEFLAPIIIIAHYEYRIDAISVRIVCDHLEVDNKDMTVTVNIYRFNNLVPRSTKTWNATMNANDVTHVKFMGMSRVFTDDFNRTNSFLKFTLKRRNNELAHTYFFPMPFVDVIDIKNPHLTFDISSKFCTPSIANKLNTFSLTINVKYPAIFVYIEIVHPKVIKYRLSANGFMQLTPMRELQITFETKNCITLHRSDIKIMTVNDLW